jgi:hypothetical protein
MNLPEDKYDIVINPDGSGTFKPKAVDWSEWVPKDKQLYWFIRDDGVIGSTVWASDRFDESHLSYGNVYPTEAMALAALPDIRRAMQIIRACRLVEPGFVPDWTQPVKKHFVAYDHFSGCWVVLTCASCVYAPAYVSTEEKARKVIELLERVK